MKPVEYSSERIRSSIERMHRYVSVMYDISIPAGRSYNAALDDLEAAIFEEAEETEKYENRHEHTREMHEA